MRFVKYHSQPICMILTLPQNVANAQKEIDRLEAEANAADAKSSNRSTDIAKKPAQENQGVNGGTTAGAELDHEKAADADVAKELEKAKIEDEDGAEGTA